MPDCGSAGIAREVVNVCRPTHGAMPDRARGRQRRIGLDAASRCAMAAGGVGSGSGGEGRRLVREKIFGRRTSAKIVKAKIFTAQQHRSNRTRPVSHTLCQRNPGRALKMSGNKALGSLKWLSRGSGGLMESLLVRNSPFLSLLIDRY